MPEELSTTGQLFAVPLHHRESSVTRPAFQVLSSAITVKNVPFRLHVVAGKLLFVQVLSARR